MELDNHPLTLSAVHVPHKVIIDSAAGSLLFSKKVDCVFFGADRITANGDVINKIGTYSLSVLSKENGVPVYCVAPTSTIDISTLDGSNVKIEQRSEDEVLKIDGHLIADSLSHAYNPAFDVTPSRYITAIITEEGICYPPFLESLAVAKKKVISKSQDAPVENLESVQQLREAMKSVNRTGEFFPPQNDPVEEKSRAVRKVDAKSEHKSFFVDGSLNENNNHTKEKLPQSLRQFPQSKSSLILTDSPDTAPQVKPSIRVTKPQISHIFQQDESSGAEITPSGELVHGIQLQEKAHLHSTSSQQSSPTPHEKAHIRPQEHKDKDMNLQGKAHVETKAVNSSEMQTFG